MVNSAKRDFEYRMRVHTRELSVTSTFHSKWQKRSRPPFFFRKSSIFEQLGSRQCRSERCHCREGRPNPVHGHNRWWTIWLWRAEWWGRGGDYNRRPSERRAAPTNRRAARVRGTLIVCLLLLVLIIEAAVRILGWPADEGYGSGRRRRRETEIRDDGQDQSWR